MTDLVACLSTGKGTWATVIKLVKTGKFDKIFLLTNKFGMENYTKDDKTELIEINSFAPEKEIRDSVKAALEGKLSGDVALNLTSGSGNEHMALLSAMLQLGVGIRLVVPTEDGFEEF